MGPRGATAATPDVDSPSVPTAAPPQIGTLTAEGTIACRALLDGRDPIHGAVAPAAVRAGDPVVARVRAPGGAEVAAQVWRISPLAAEIVRTPALGAIAVGDAVELTLRVGASETTLARVPVVAIHAERGRELVALRWAPEATPPSAGEKRAAARWACGAEYVPTGVTPSEVRYSDFIHFRIAEISRTGMRLVTSLRNKFLVPGVAFEATCSFPTVGEVRIAFRVVHARVVVGEGGKEALALGTTYAVRDARSLERIGQYLLQFGAGTTVSDLRATGFPVRAAHRAVDFGFVQTPEEYREVLALRRLAYVHAKKASADVKDVDMGDGFDACSRIVYARHGGRIVASVRLMFPRAATDRLKHEDYLSLPDSVPPRDQIVEASKACTHPDFRGGDLFYRMMNLAALTTMQAGRRFILMSCTRSLLPVYAKLGFRPIRAGYVHPSMHLAHEILVAEVARMVAGQNVNPVIWHLVDGPALWDFSCRCGVVPRTRWLDARVALYKVFAPLARLLEPVLLRRIARGKA